jgi:hypothetical protein
MGDMQEEIHWKISVRCWRWNVGAIASGSFSPMEPHYNGEI